LLLLTFSHGIFAATTVGSLGGTDPVTSGVNSTPAPPPATAPATAPAEEPDWITEAIIYLRDIIVETWYSYAIATFSYSKTLIIKYVSGTGYWTNFVALLSSMPPEITWAFCKLELLAFVLIILGARVTRFVLRIIPMPFNPWAH
jgi:hypothetical protein